MNTDCFLKWIVSISLLIAAVSACSENNCAHVKEKKIISDKALLETVCAYYKAEQDRNWMDAYKIRRNIYKNNLEFETYKKYMAEDATGWELMNINIISHKMTNNTAEIEIIFDEKINKVVKNRSFIKSEIEMYLEKGDIFNEFSFDPKTNIVSIRELTKWRFENGKWHVEYPGERLHFGMNDPMVFDN